MNVILIDDEPDAIESLSIMLKEFAEGINIVGTASSAIEGIKLINTKKPDLVFLDIEMPHASGFDVLEGVVKRNFQVIFTTAYDHYAIKAIKANAIDYLMKPIDIDELNKAILKAKDQINQSASLTNTNLLNTLKEKEIRRIPICVNGNYVLIEIEDIQYIKSQGAYSEVNTFDKVYLVSKNLGHYESLLPSNAFYRISNSCIVNVNKIRVLSKEDGGKVVLQNNAQIAISRARKTALKKILNI